MKSSDHNTKRVEAFWDLIIAGMKDAAIERKMTQFKCEITPEGRTTPVQVRIIIVPETMDIDVPAGIKAN